MKFENSNKFLRIRQILSKFFYIFDFHGTYTIYEENIFVDFALSAVFCLLHVFGKPGDPFFPWFRWILRLWFLADFRFWRWKWDTFFYGKRCGLFFAGPAQKCGSGNPCVSCQKWAQTKAFRGNLPIFRGDFMQRWFRGVHRWQTLPWKPKVRSADPGFCLTLQLAQICRILCGIWESMEPRWRQNCKINSVRQIQKVRFQAENCPLIKQRFQKFR